MSKLRRTLSMRKKKSYSTLAPDYDMFKTPPMKITPIKEVCEGRTTTRTRRSEDDESSTYSKIDSIKGMKGNVEGSFANLQSTSTPIAGLHKENKGSSGNSVQKAAAKKKKQANVQQFLGLSTVKSVLSNIGQKLRGGKQFKRITLQDSPSMVNGAYSTPRRSDRLKSKGTPSPLTLKMYSPFCIETPGATSFSRISKRKAASDLIESPMIKTPRRMVQAAVKDHKKLAKSLSSTDVIIPTSGGY